MCELLCVSSESPARVDLSLEVLARRGDPEGMNHDGWGIASYQGRDARLVKEPAAARTSEIVRFIEEHDYWSTRVLYHLRHATQGGVSYENTQPFLRELGGFAHVFCHNGNLELPSRRLRGPHRPIGETDSEWAFCYLLCKLTELWAAADDVPELEARREVVASVAEELRTLGQANFLYSDGDVIFVHAHWRYIDGPDSSPMPGVHILTDMPDLTASAVAVELLRGELFVAASVPLSGDDWRPMGEGELLAVRGGRIVPAD